MESHSPVDPASLLNVIPYCNILPTPPGTEAACATPLLQQPTNLSPTDISTISAKLEEVKISENANSLKQRDILPQPGHGPVHYSGDVPAEVSEQFLRPSTDPYLRERFFNHKLLDIVYELFYDIERGPRQQKWLKRLLEDIEDRYRTVVKDLTQTWEKEKTELETDMRELETEMRRQNTELETEMRRQNTELETEMRIQKTNLEYELKLQHNDAKHDKELLENKFQSAERRTMDLEQTFTRWRSMANQDKSNKRGGSITRAQCWEKDDVIIKVKPTLKKSNELSEKELKSLNKTFKNIPSKPDAPEAECYGPIQDAVNTFVPNITCYITSKQFYLAGEAPDLSVCLVKSIHAHTHLCYGIIEAKRPAEALDIASNLGQVKDYILSLLRAQTSRNRFWGILTNVKENILIEIQRGQTSENPHTITKYAPMEWAEVMNYLRDVTSTVDLCPPPLHFAKELGSIEEIMTASEKWTLGEFSMPNKLKKMVVKCSKPSPPKAYHRLELNILRHLAACRKLDKAPKSIVKLVWDPAIRAGDNCYEISDPDSDPPIPRIQFGIAPVGREFQLAAFTTPAEFQNAIDTLLDGLNWLHHIARVIHRDIRPANVIYDWIRKRAVIIDFDCAFQLQTGEAQNVQLTTYGGGLICLPTEVLKLALEKFEQGRKPVIQDILYQPQPAHDLGAFVLLVLATLFPVQFKEFPAHRLQESESKAEIQELLDLHSALAASSIWGTIWNGALQGNVEELKRIGNLGWWPRRVTADTQGKIGGSVSFAI
ncbi:hypothetical protein BGX38DRAFT_1146604 [Terfezia claveryi]|nr:hypothetical protein BGX38DRAFT_1146604 [Terfezia claveryi]